MSAREPEPARAAEPFAFGVVGPGAIADVFAAAVAEAGVARVVRVLGRRPARAQDFARRHGARVVEDLRALFRPEGRRVVDGLYVATPHTLHAEAVRYALERGVPVLCEKPLTTDPVETAALYDLADRGGVPLMEAWMYRAHPQVHALLRHVAEGTIGKVQRVEAEFAFSAPFDPDHRLFSRTLGGGAILDVGGYPLSFALAVVRAAQGTLPEAGFDAVAGELSPSGVDGEARVQLDLGGVAADLRVSIQREALGERILGRARVVGERGELALEEPWCPEGERRGRLGVLHVVQGGASSRVELRAEHDCFALEATAFASLVRARAVSLDAPVTPAWPLVDRDESVAIATLAARWRADVLAGAAQPS